MHTVACGRRLSSHRGKGQEKLRVNLKGQVRLQLRLGWTWRKSSGVYSQHKPKKASPNQAKRSDSKLGSFRCLLVTPTGKGGVRWARDTAQGRERTP